MGKLVKFYEPIYALRSALSLKTLQQQWKEMIDLMFPNRRTEQAAPVEEEKTVFCMRVRLREWPRGEGTLVEIKKKNFTFGNADTFDVCLNAGNMQVGDVWCSVFFDRTLNGYVVMQAMGSFHVCVTGDDEPYRHGDWSLYPEGFDYRTVAQNNLLIPISSRTNPQKTIFHIENHYFIEMWAYDADILPTGEMPPASAVENEEAAGAASEEPEEKTEEGGTDE